MSVLMAFKIANHKFYFRGSARFCDSRGGSGTSGTQFTSATAGPISPTAAAGANERSNNSLAEDAAESADGFRGGFSKRVRSVRLMPDPRYGQVTNRGG